IEARAFDHLLAGYRECDMMPREIAAFDRRDVLRLESVAVLRVVPVVEVAAAALEGVQRLERGLETLDDVEGADPAEIASGHRRQQIQSDVRGRRAVRNHRARYLLEVVRRQCVVRRTDERREEAPRPPRDQAEGS